MDKLGQGSIIRLSKNCAEINAQSPLDMMTDLKMNFVDVDEGLSPRDFYGKVIRPSEETKQFYLVHFTSVPPEVGFDFRAFRLHPAQRTRI